VKAANWEESSSTTPYNLYKAAEAYYEVGDYDKAQELTQRILNEYPGSPDVVAVQKLQGKIAIAG
jgi:outer membrane protein assembly factor BamD (BamD/ComL family)